MGSNLAPHRLRSSTPHISAFSNKSPRLDTRQQHPSASADNTVWQPLGLVVGPYPRRSRSLPGGPRVDTYLLTTREDFSWPPATLTWPRTPPNAFDADLRAERLHDQLGGRVCGVGRGTGMGEASGNRSSGRSGTPRGSTVLGGDSDGGLVVDVVRTGAALDALDRSPMIPLSRRQPRARARDPHPIPRLAERPRRTRSGINSSPDRAPEHPGHVRYRA